MEKKLQDQAWASLPDGFKKEARHLYSKGLIINRADGADRPVRHASVLLSELFGHDNLAAEPDTNNGTMDDTKRTKETELNLCELLKGCEGMELYSPCYGKVEVVNVNPITIVAKGLNGKKHTFRFDGCHNSSSQGELMLFPSKDCRTWDGWRPPKKRWKPKKNEDYYVVEMDGVSTISADEYRNDIQCYTDEAAECGNCFRTKEQAQEAAKRVREVLEKYHDEIGE